MNNRIGCVANKYPRSQQLMLQLTTKYGIISAKNKESDDFDIMVVLGGDGFMLRMLHKFAGTHVKLYGINCGAIGFLLNRFSEANLIESIEKANLVELSPIHSMFYAIDNRVYSSIAFNEICVTRKTCQAANIRVVVDDVERINPLIADGILLATPSGSTAYNTSAGGVTLPLNSGLRAITPICPFRPRRWHGAIIPDHTKVEFEILQPARREVSGFADFLEFRNVVKVVTHQSNEKIARVLFDHDHSLDDRIIKEQFYDVI